QRMTRCGSPGRLGMHSAISASISAVGREAMRWVASLRPTLAASCTASRRYWAMVSSSAALMRAVWAASVPAAAARVWADIEAALRSPAATPSLKASSRAWATSSATTSSGTPIGSGTIWGCGAISAAAAGLAPRGRSARSRSKVKRARAAMASGYHLVVGLGLDDDDLALGGQILGHRHHAALGLVDILQAHRTHAGHVVLQ